MFMNLACRGLAMVTRYRSTASGFNASGCMLINSWSHELSCHGLAMVQVLGCLSLYSNGAGLLGTWFLELACHGLAMVTRTSVASIEFKRKTTI